MTAHTIEEGLAKFRLISGAGDGEQTACAMTLLAWLNGDEWSDHPSCAQRLLPSLVIHANDDSATTADMRAELVRLGTTGVLDTWWVPDQVVLWAISGDPKRTHYQRVIEALPKISAWKETRERVDLSRADLYGANLSRADLSGADLYGADLSRANLSRANLSGAKLSRAKLSGANLSGADLYGADLSGADLSGADLSRADLSGANLSRADLYGADLSGADLSGADLVGDALNIDKAYNVPAFI